MPQDLRPEHIVGYEVGFEGEIDWEKPVVFPLFSIERFDRTDEGRAIFTVGTDPLGQVEFVTRSSFDELVARLGAIH